MPYMKRQLHWISRTVMVQNNNVEEALKVVFSVYILSSSEAKDHNYVLITRG